MEILSSVGQNRSCYRRDDPLDWSTWLRHGDEYLKAGTPKGATSRFTQVIRYNILSMALEGYVMAIMDYNHELPYNHTYSDLMAGLKQVVPDVEPNLINRILKHEAFQNICDEDAYERNTPADSDLDDLMMAIGELQTIAHHVCEPASV